MHTDSATIRVCVLEVHASLAWDRFLHVCTGLSDHVAHFHKGKLFRLCKHGRRMYEVLRYSKATPNDNIPAQVSARAHAWAHESYENVEVIGLHPYLLTVIV